jgi:hypothetical protein
VSVELHAPVALPGVIASAILWLGGWVGPRAGLDVVKKRKIPSHRQVSNPRTPIVHPVASRYTDGAALALTMLVVCEEMDWIHMTDERVQWRALVNAPQEHKTSEIRNGGKFIPPLSDYQLPDKGCAPCS